MEPTEHFDVLVIGSGPAGQKAAIQAVKGNRRAAIVEREAGVGGFCVHRGTIPSKTLRESAAAVARLRRGADVFDVRVSAGTEMSRLLGRLDKVVNAHVAYMSAQLARNNVTLLKGRARFTAPTRVEVESPDGARRSYGGDVIVIATGSRPRTPAEIPVDHEHILDSDSILSLAYLPEALTILGGGVIASEYASIFALLGVRVTMIDRYARPLGFLDSELTDKFLDELGRSEGRYLGEQTVTRVCWDGVSQVETHLADGRVVRSDKMLVAMGREANLDGLDLAAAGLSANAKGLIDVDEFCRTAVPSIYAVGDVIGPPSLASAAMEQGRRAVCHALALTPGSPSHTIPMGVYTVPEISSVGMSASEARKKGLAVIEGRARFDQVARGQISGIDDGLLKIVSDPEGRKILGVQIVGDGATELIHVGQMAMLAGAPVEVFIENIFNFPTLAEAYRIAALDIARQRGWR